MSLDPAKVCAVLVTMGDVDLTPILDPMPYGQVVIWDNALHNKTARQFFAEMGRYADALLEGGPEDGRALTPAATGGADFRVFGRYIAIRYATRPVIFFQDDDCVLTREQHQAMLNAYEPGVVTGNMIYDDPVWAERYKDTTLLGWGAIFDRDLPFRAFKNYARYHPLDWEFMTSPGGAEVVFPMLSRCKTIIAGAEWLGEKGQEVFGRSNRMSNQPAFLETRLRWLDKARHVRDRLAAEGIAA